MGINTQNLRTQLMTLANYPGTHKEQADKYRQLLEIILSNKGKGLFFFLIITFL